MQSRRTLVAAGLSLVLTGVAGGAQPAAAAVTTTVTSITVPTEPVDTEVVAGAVIRMHLIDPVGIVEGDGSEELDASTYACFNVTGGGLNGCYAAGGHLIGGTAKDGDWQFDPFAQPRPYGTWEVNRLHVVRADGTTANIDLRPLGFPLSFRVISRFGAFFDQQSQNSNQTATITYGQTLTLRARAYWVDENAHRRPIAGGRVTVLQEDQTEPVIDGDERVLTTLTTAADGTLSVTLTPDRNAFRIYLQLAKSTTPEGIRYMDGIAWTGRVNVQVAIGVFSRPTALKTRTIGYVEGNVRPLHVGQFAYLQRFSGGAWVKVSSAVIRGSGRFTLAAQPPNKGANRYRVYKASDADHMYNVTPEFIITGI
jgi:hypothetical protein